MALKKVRLHYSYSKGWLIFWTVVFCPVAMVLLLTGGSFEVDGNLTRMHYDGSRGWLCFWTVVFFPVAVVLGFLNGFSIEIDSPRVITGPE
jgi:hypothetical protein